MRLPPYLIVILLLSACGSAFVPAQGAGGLYQDGGIFKPAVEMIATARSRALVEMYEFGRTDLERGLVAARLRGADVRVVLDPTIPISVVVGRRLAAAGVPVRFYPVDDSLGQIDHVKLLLGDSSGLVGGMNWGVGSARNHDFALLLRGVGKLERLKQIFEQDWSLAGGVPRPLAPVVEPLAQTAPGTEIRGLLEAVLDAARRHIDAEVFALTDPEVILRLQTAHRRGVEVRVILDRAQVVNLPAFTALRRSGAGVRWATPVGAGAKLHAKAVLADGRLVLGSANWSRHGLEINHELDVATEDSRAVAAYSARFEADWRAAA